MGLITSLASGYVYRVQFCVQLFESVNVCKLQYKIEMEEAAPDTYIPPAGRAGRVARAGAAWICLVWCRGTARRTGNPNVAGSVPTSITYIVLVYLYICHTVIYVFSDTNKNRPTFFFVKAKVCKPEKDQHMKE